MRRRFRGLWLGRVRYAPGCELQLRLHAQRRAGALGDTVLFLEHEPVITLGRGARREHLLASPEQLARRGIELVQSDRGGDVTVHAPGQLVCYPIVDLAPDRRDVRRYVGDLLDTMRGLAAHYGVSAGVVSGQVGLWTDATQPATWPGAEHALRLAKLGAIGVHLSRWVTRHGFAFNLTTDLELFSLIVPCGIREHPVTSIQQLTGQTPAVREAAERALGAMAPVFDADVGLLEDVSTGELLEG